MTREEYEDLKKRRSNISKEVNDFEMHVCYILSQVGHKNDGEISFDIDIVDGIAKIQYLEHRAHGSCCGEEWQTASIPIGWIFAGIWEAEYAIKKAADQQAEKDRIAAEEKANKDAEEAYERTEFERLKQKFYKVIEEPSDEYGRCTKPGCHCD